jgi:hypothetical protein
LALTNSGLENKKKELDRDRGQSLSPKISPNSSSTRSSPSGSPRSKRHSPHSSHSSTTTTTTTTTSPSNIPKSDPISIQGAMTENTEQPGLVISVASANSCGGIYLLFTRNLLFTITTTN